MIRGIVNGALVVFVMFLVNAGALAEVLEGGSAPRHTFTPHSTSSARTGEWGSVALQRTPGTNRNTNVLISSLTVTILPRLELGTAVLLHPSPYHISNYNLKLNFFRSDFMDWAFSYSNILWRSIFYDTGTTLIYQRLNIQSHSLTTNIHPEGSQFSYGLSATFSSTLLRVEALKAEHLETSEPEYNLDISYQLSEREDITLGLGTLRDQGLTAYEKTRFGFGISYALYRPQRLFSKPSVGIHYTPENGSFLWSFATTFY